MFKTIATIALIGATEAIKLQDTTAAPSTAFDVEEAFEKAQSGEYTAEDLENMMEHVSTAMEGKEFTDAIDWAAENGIDGEFVMGAIEGAELSGSFDKHDIHAFAMDLCCHYQPTAEDLEHVLNYAGEALGIDDEEAQALLEKAGDVFDISEEELHQAVEDCFAVADQCAAKTSTDAAKTSTDAEKTSTDAKTTTLAQMDFDLEDLENVTPEEAADFLKKHEREIKEALAAHQKDICAWAKKNEKAIRKWVKENESEIKEFAAGLEAELGPIDWENVEAEAKDYLSGN